MEIYTMDGMDFRKDERGDFLINPSREAFIKIKDTAIRNIELNGALGMMPGNGSLGFLKKYDFVEGISIVAPPKALDISAIHYLNNLKLLSITTEFDSAIDFDCFKELVYCQISWNKKIQNIQKLHSLKTFTIYKYQNTDLTELSNLTSLKKLSVIQSRIRSLKGIGHLPLEKLDLAYLMNFESLEGIQFLIQMKELYFENTPKIGNIDLLKELKNLEVLTIHNGKNISSLIPLKDLKSLEYIQVSGNTNILDGDMTPLLGRKDASIGTRKHYTHKSEEIDKTNGTIRPKQTWDY